MSRPNRKLSFKLESSASEMPVRPLVGQNAKQSKVSSSASNITRPTKMQTTAYRAVNGGKMRNENKLLESIGFSEERKQLYEPEEEETEKTEETDTEDTDTDIAIKSQKENQFEAEKKKHFYDWNDFYSHIFGSLENKSDLIIAFTHYILIKNGFRCMGLGDNKTYAKNDKGSINIPEGWNHFPKYTIRYIHNGILYLLLAIELDHQLLINFLNTNTNVVTNITVFPESTVHSITCGGPVDVLIPNPEKFAQSLYSNLVQTFIDSKACTQPPTLFTGSSSQQINTLEDVNLRQSNANVQSREVEMVDAKTRNEEYKETQGWLSLFKHKSPQRKSLAEQQPQTSTTKT